MFKSYSAQKQSNKSVWFYCCLLVCFHECLENWFSHPNTIRWMEIILRSWNYKIMWWHLKMNKMQLLEAPAFQIHGQLEDGDPLWAADGPRAGHHPTGHLELLQELRKHCRGRRQRFTAGNPGLNGHVTVTSENLETQSWPTSKVIHLWLKKTVAINIHMKRISKKIWFWFNSLMCVFVCQ